MASRGQAVLLVRRGDIEARPDRPAGLEAAARGRGRLAAVVGRSLATFCVSTTESVFGLSYDDGPDPEQTSAILDVLARHCAHATFFVLAGPAAKHPEILRRMVAEGHEVALHGLDHASLLTRSTSAAVAAVLEARAVVESIVGTSVRHYRPPYGAHTLRQARAIHRAGLELVVWSGDAKDWVQADEDVIIKRAWATVFPGAFLLLHDTRADPETALDPSELPTFDRAAVLEDLLLRATAAGYSALTVGDLMDRFPAVKSWARERSRM